MENNKLVFVNGVSIYSPRENCPKTIKANMIIKVKDFLAFVAEHNLEDTVRIDIRKSEAKGTLYASLNTWKPMGEKPAELKKDTTTYTDTDGKEVEIPF